MLADTNAEKTTTYRKYGPNDECHGVRHLKNIAFAIKSGRNMELLGRWQSLRDSKAGQGTRQRAQACAAKALSTRFQANCRANAVPP